MTSVPNSGEGVQFGEIKQDEYCLDTMSHQGSGTVGLYRCHGAGGNQVINL